MFESVPLKIAACRAAKIGREGTIKICGGGCIRRHTLRVRYVDDVTRRMVGADGIVR